jgi:aryl-alcohol dehydrogenase-like predicted oxidoreductase
MDSRRMGHTGLYLSTYTLGTMTFGNEADEAESARMVGTYLDAGGYVFDTADGYCGGRSEEYLGSALKGRRDDVVISTKFRFATGPGPNNRGGSRRHILDTVHGSLRRLGTDWIDIYLLHCWDPRTGLDETVETLGGLVRDGKVRYVGVSNLAAWQIAKGLGLAALRGCEPFSVLQPQYSLLSRTIEREILPLAESEDLGVMAWSPLGGGVLSAKYNPGGTDFPQGTRAADSAKRGSPTMQNRFTDRTGEILRVLREVATEHGYEPAQVAVGWVARQPAVSTVLLGARTQQQLERNLAAADCVLPDAAWARLDEVSAIEPEYPADLIAYSSAV